MIAHGKGKKTERNVEIVRKRENDEAIDHQESFPIHVHTFFLLCHNNGRIFLHSTILNMDIYFNQSFCVSTRFYASVLV